MLNISDIFVIFMAVYGFVILFEVFRHSSAKVSELTNFKPLNRRICLTFLSSIPFSYIYTSSILNSIHIAFANVFFAYLFKLIEDLLTGYASRI